MKLLNNKASIRNQNKGTGSINKSYDKSKGGKGKSFNPTNQGGKGGSKGGKK